MIISALMTASFAVLIAVIAFSGVGLNVLLWALIYWVIFMVFSPRSSRSLPEATLSRP